MWSICTVQCPSPLKKLRVWRDTTGGLMSSSQITNSQVKGRWLMYRNCLRRAYKYIATLNRKKLPKNYSIQLTHCYNLTISSRQSLERKTVRSMPKIERDPSLKSVCKPLVLKLWHWSLSTVLKRGGGEEKREVAKESSTLSWTILEGDIWWPRIIKGLEKQFYLYNIWYCMITKPHCLSWSKQHGWHLEYYPLCAFLNQEKNKNKNMHTEKSKRSNLHLEKLGY